MFYHSLPSRLRKHMVYGNMSANSDLQLEENRITQIFGTLLEKKIAPPTTLFSHKYVYITNLHKMEKRWNKIKECPLADGTLRMSNRATEFVMKNKSYCTLSGKKELIKHNVISMKHSDSVYFCLIYTVCTSYLRGAITYYLQRFSLYHISCNYLINGTTFRRMGWITTNLGTSSCAVPVTFFFRF